MEAASAKLQGVISVIGKNEIRHHEPSRAAFGIHSSLMWECKCFARKQLRSAASAGFTCI